MQAVQVSESKAPAGEGEQLVRKAGKRVVGQGSREEAGQAWPGGAGGSQTQALPYTHNRVHPGFPGPQHTPQNPVGIPAKEDAGKTSRVRGRKPHVKELELDPTGDVRKRPVLFSQSGRGEGLCRARLPALWRSLHNTGDGSSHCSFLQEKPISTGDWVPFPSLCEAPSWVTSM